MIFVQLISFKAYHDLERLYNKQVDIEIIYNRKSQGRTDYECASVIADVHRVLIYLCWRFLSIHITLDLDEF